MPAAGDPALPSHSQQLAGARAARGLTQAALAARIGVSRQFLNQMESGRVLPNVVIALRLAAALGSSVEALFGAAASAAMDRVSVVAGEPGLVPGARLRIGRVGAQWIAYAADTAAALAAGFGTADAVLVTPTEARLLVPASAAANHLLLAGCDPALALLHHVVIDGREGRCHWVDCGSGRALDLLAAGRVHVAGIHYPGADGRGNIAELARRDRQRAWGIVRFTRWEQGWLVRPGDRARFAGIRDFAAGKWRLANRDASAAARRWLDGRISAARLSPADIRGYDTTFPSAADAARAVAERRADATVGPRASAVAHGLEFVPAEAVDFDLIAAARWWRGPAGRALCVRLEAVAASGALATLPGYSKVATGTPRRRRAA